MTTNATTAPTGKLKVDPEDLTLGEVEELERILGGSFEDAIGKGKPQAPALIVIAYLIVRRDRPEFTLEDARELKLSDIDTEDDPAGE